MMKVFFCHIKKQNAPKKIYKELLTLLPLMRGAIRKPFSIYTNL